MRTDLTVPVYILNIFSCGCYNILGLEAHLKKLYYGVGPLLKHTILSRFARLVIDSGTRQELCSAVTPALSEPVGPSKQLHAAVWLGVSTTPEDERAYENLIFSPSDDDPPRHVTETCLLNTRGIAPALISHFAALIEIFSREGRCAGHFNSRVMRTSPLQLDDTREVSWAQCTAIVHT